MSPHGSNKSSRERGDHASQGVTLHSARLYDWMALGYTFGREGRLRERTLDAAGITAGEQVLDVGCGTGTLTLAAKKRVGAKGSVRGVDASPEMIARAKTKAEQDGVPVIFETAAAQSLPFPDAAFDVVLCSLALHHLPEGARATALAEMRRVLKPDGRVLIVEFSRERGALAWLNPVALLHALKNPRMLDEATALAQRSGFQHVVTGPLGLAGIGYVLGSRDRAQATP
jgi:ubiquinone/menaquinone biosynthesis C-methylase UbiE